MGNALAIDLASKRYRDFGFAFLAAGSKAPELLEPSDLGLDDPPDVARLASALEAFARRTEVDKLLVDGPQGWRLPSSPIEHMRLCERVLNTPGKSGTPGNVKPKTYFNYVHFSIELFRSLREDHGWSLFASNWARHNDRRWLVEVYPSVAWTLLGLQRLPGKARAKRGLKPYAEALERASGMLIPDHATHDQLQALVVLPLGVAIEARSEGEVLTVGIDPILKGGVVFEGLIACPRLPAAA